MRAMMILVSLATLASFASVFLIHPSRSIAPDSVGYLQLAQGLREHSIFSADPASGTPELHRVPGYPAFLALFGPWKGLERLRLLLLAQVFLTLGSAWMLADTARISCAPLTTPRLVAVGLFLCNPVILLLTFQILTETLFVFLCTLSLWCLARSLNVRRGFHTVLSGLWLGAAVLIRPIGLLIVPAGVGAYLVARDRGQSSSGPRPAGRRGQLLLWAGAAIAVPTAWAVHNGTCHGYWGVSKTGVSFLYAAYGEPRLVNGTTMRGLNPYDVGELSAGDALASVCAAIAAEPASFAGGLVTSVARTLFGPGEWSLRTGLLGECGSRPGSGPVPCIHVDETEQGLAIHTSPAPDQHKPGPRSAVVWSLVLWSLGITLITYLGAAAGAIRHLRRASPVLTFSMLAFLLLTMTSPGYGGHARFRAPMVPYLTLLAAASLRRRSGLPAPPPSCNPLPKPTGNDQPHGGDAHG